MSRHIIFILLTITTILSCQSENENSIFLNNYELVNIKCNQDTLISLKSGVQLAIKETTFNCKESEKILLKVTLVFSNIDMILNDLSTVDSDGGILESAGMIKIEILEGSMSDISTSLNTVITSTSNPSQMKLYKLNEDGNNWTQTSDSIVYLEKNKYINGKELYETQCRNCHSTNLKLPGTGPALGNVTSVRDSSWLINFTRNSQKLIYEKDPLAVEIWNKWGGSIMTSFENLSDNEITDIYSFIELESKIQGLTQDSVYVISGLDSNLIKTYSNYFLNSSTSSNNDMLYFSNLYPDYWYNIDRLISTDNKIESPKITFTNSSKREIKIFSVFKNSKTTLQFHNQNGTYSIEHLDKKEIMWPANQEITIVAFEVNNKNQVSRAVFLDHTFQDSGNELVLTLEAMNPKSFRKKLENI